ncbi:hypothetical protein VTL71DRAFT_2392 [Oculimacula yallundae]|uniref:SET domain-containing protein n=1 Tax=Oculimacula yallundae TaxID=86028 RepID=A0ABR4CA33_9HELO
MIDLKRAPSYPKTQRFDSALSDFKYPPTEKQTVRSVQESLLEAGYLYSLDRFRECSEVLKIICKEYPENKQAKTELTRTIFRLLEQQRGGYNFKTLYAEVATLRPPQLDHATYIGPVDIRESPGKDRGLFTTYHVKAGDLLICEKAFSYSYSDVSIGTKAGLRIDTIQKLNDNPHLIPQFNSMYHGSYQPILERNGKPVVDEYLVERVITLNSFGGSISTLASHTTGPNTSGHSSGVWVFSATINHACIANCRRSFIGDMQIIRASCDLPPDTELLFPYHSLAAQDHDYEATQRELEEYGFVCACELCSDAKSMSKQTLERRRVLRTELSAAFHTGGQRGAFDCGKVDTARIERTLASLEGTYTKSAVEVPRTGLWDPYLALTRMYAVLGRSQNVIWSTLKILEMLGFSIHGASFPCRNGESKIIVVEKWGLVVDYLVECWMVLWTAYAVLGDVERADMARNFAVVSYRIVVGEDQTFEETYGAKGTACVAQGRLWSSQ